MLFYSSLILGFKYYYGSYSRAIIKQRYGIRGLVQDHHIIPRQFSSRVNIDIDSPINLIILPTSYGNIYLDTKRPIHENGHPKYNKYIGKLLDQNYTEEYIITFLRSQLLSGNISYII